jgi:CO/xanthine dehydrogenase Mo-binding subunit
VAKYGDRVTIIGVPGKDDTGPMQEFVARHGLEGILQAVDVDGSLWQRYGVGYQPAWVFINQDGTVRVHAGGLFGDGIDQAIDELLAS